jgi:nitrilase
MAPARIALSSLNIEVHAAAWPGHAFLDGVIDASTRHLAHENACFVLVAREFMSPDLAPDEVSISDEARNHWQAHGGSAIIAPGGEYLVEPVFGKETIVTAEIDLSRIPVCKWFFDGTGHYARPDVFQLKWDKRQKPVVDMITDD